MRFSLPLLLLLALPLTGQLPVPPEFQTLLDSMDIRLNHPLDGDFKLRHSAANDYLEDMVTLTSRREKLEMRFHLIPESKLLFYQGRPHLKAGLVQMNLASNDEDAVTAIHSFGEEELAVLNADWARMYTFRPKSSYSFRRQAQMIAVYREGKGMGLLMLLFDKAPPTIEGRQLTLRFR